MRINQPVGSLSPRRGQAGLGNKEMDLENLVVRFSANTSNLTAGVAGVKTLLAGFGLAAVGVGAMAVKMGADFQSSMVQLVTGAGESRKNIGMLSQGVLDMARQTGTSTQQLTSGLFMIESASFRGKQGLDVLRVAAEGAKVGNSDLATTSMAMISVMKDYHLNASQAGDAMNFLTAVVQNGTTTMQDLAGSIHSVLPTASSLGVNLRDVGGAMATMTGETVPAADAATYLRQMLMSLAAPASSGQKALKAIGLSAGEVSADMKKSLPDTLKLIMQHLAETYKVGSPQYVDALKNIAGGSKQMQGFLDLTGSHLKEFGDNVNNVSSLMNKGKGSVVGWSDVQQTFNFKMSQAKESVETLMIKVGTALLPALGNLLGSVTPLITKFGDWIDKNHIVDKAIGAVKDVLNGLKTGISDAGNIISTTIQTIKNIVSWFNTWHDIILSVAGVITGLFTPALIKAGVEAVTSGTKLAASFVANVVKSGVEAVVAGAKTAASFTVNIVKAGLAGWESAGKLALWIGNVIASGTQAVIAGAKVTASFIASMVKAAAQAVTSGAVLAAQFISKLVLAGVQAVITAGQFVASLIPAIVSMTASAITAAVTAIPGLILGFIGWAGAAASAAIATIAATWPILLVVAGIALLIAGIVLLITHWKQVSDFALMIWGHIRQFFEDDVVKPIGNLFNSMGTNIHNVLVGIGNFFSGFGTNVHNIIKKIGDVFSGLGTTVHNIWNGIVSAIKNAINFVIGLINNFIGGIDNIGIDIGNVHIHPNIPKIPLLAQGGIVPPGGAAIAGETGKPELVLGGTSGASVLGVSQTASLMAHSQQPIQVHVHNYIDGREMANTAMIRTINEIRSSGNPIGQVA